ncbi:Late embryogenesis abundant protein, LEA-14 [Corchorus olitorius]|uniref:Late embryogenesis abundant protein, LEA-14 n=1 Tax=Corchorus olitorius TaxID=93759 RepID=A0A1R3KI70_9ROSI|nr:Late embryogenesis abundant protein, LEA-14 [Corchorus olitorius]
MACREMSYPHPDKNIVGPIRSESFAFYVDAPPSPTSSPINFNTNRNTNTSPSSSSPNKSQCCLILSVILLTIVTVTCSVPIIVFYGYGPRSPVFHVQQLALHYPIFYEGPTRLSSLLNITMAVENPSTVIGLFYQDANSIVLRYSDMPLSSGIIPPFYLSPKNETVVQSSLSGLGVALPDDVRKNLEDEHRNKKVPLRLNLTAKLRYKFASSLITFKATLEASCALVLENLDDCNTPPKLVSHSCNSAVSYWIPAIKA